MVNRQPIQFHVLPIDKRSSLKMTRKSNSEINLKFKHRSFIIHLQITLRKLNEIEISNVNHFATTKQKQQKKIRKMHKAEIKEEGDAG